MVRMASEEIRIRNFDRQRDTARVVDLESRCEVGPRESFFLFTDTMGDPMCRIRNSPQYKMLVHSFTRIAHFLSSTFLILIMPILEFSYFRSQN